MSSGAPLLTPSYYDILQLSPSRSSQTLTKESVKTAYHRALLVHHPDKASKHASSTNSTVQQSAHVSLYSIDQIVTAYETLADPLKSSVYNQHLEEISRGVTLGMPSQEKGTHPGVETLDLEDLNFSKEMSTWHYKCRCGNEEGYTVTEAELDSEADYGEIFVGCRGCSLFIKILFGVTDTATGTGN